MKNTIQVIAVCITLLLSSFVISKGMGSIIKEKRTVSVRGLAEREVPADMAVWKLSFSLGANTLPELQKKIISQTEIVTDFLKTYGLSDEDYAVQAPEITDTSVELYIDKSRQTFVYVAKQCVLVRSGKVDAVKLASTKTVELVGSGISVNSDYDSKVKYDFNGLNQIKPEMIALATQNAREAAEQFAHDSHSKVGKIMNASQGLFSIEDAAPGLEDLKNVRVVTTVVYSLAD